MDLTIEQLSVSYGRGRNEPLVVDRADLSVAGGGALGIVGESGSGKSSLARAVVGLAPVVGGDILLDGSGRRAGGRRWKTLQRRVQMVLQDPYSSLDPRMTIGDAIGEVRQAHGSKRTNLTTETDRLLEQVGLDRALAFALPAELSGGQRQRAAIARAMAADPAILIADEVTSSLDVSVQASILNLLRHLRREVGFTLILISHNLAVVRYICDDVAVMYLGRIIEIERTEELLARPAHPYTKTLLDAVPRLYEAAAPFVADIADPPDVRARPSGCAFHPRCPVGPLHRADRAACIDQDPFEDRARRPHLAACHFPYAEEVSVSS